MEKTAIFWFRRDLRIIDNTGLFHALKENEAVLLVFIFDSSILEKLSHKADKRVSFIHQTLTELNRQVQRNGSAIYFYYGTPKEAFEAITKSFDVSAVYANRDYEPQTILRDEEIAQQLAQKRIPFFTFKDQVIFEKSEVAKGDGFPYTVFTPYMKKWKAKLLDTDLNTFPSEKLLRNLFPTGPLPMPSLKSLGFSKPTILFPSPKADEERIENYHLNRETPAVDGTSRLSVHLRFGTVSIRELTKLGLEKNEKWLNELIWRNFYQMILWHFPHVETKAFKPAYDHIPWRKDENDFNAWCAGKTGYPLVDAGMRQLNKTGFMHNRVRMVAASFLTRHLLIDWRLGAAYFADKLLDFDLASNNGGWQWASGSGCDAVPYFRIFNPTTQTQKFDPQHVYIKKWVPEFEDISYPKPIVDHKFARERALRIYRETFQRVYSKSK